MCELTYNRALQTIDSNTLPIATPEKRKQIQKCQTSSAKKLLQVSVSTPAADIEGSTPVMMMGKLTGGDKPTPIPMYSDLLENAHKPKYSQVHTLHYTPCVLA
jgi:hypothetical protein